MEKKAFQDYYPDDLSHCYGCGRLNEYGLQIKSYWDEEESVCIHQPAPRYMAIPGIINESGQKLLSVPNSQSFNLTSSNGKNKLLIYKNIGRGFLDDNETLVYALPNKK